MIEEGTGRAWGEGGTTTVGVREMKDHTQMSQMVDLIFDASMYGV